MPSIRPYQDKDRERVQSLCIENAGCAEASLELQQFILLQYCNYYIEQEPENCFVAVDAADKAIGYIICSDNYNYYERKFSEIYLKQAQELSMKYYIDARLDMITHAMFRDKYPAHFHIDILAGYQRGGLGSQLVETLKAHLKGRGVRSMMLVVGEENDRGRAFYKKNGFEQLLITHYGVAMGIEF